MSNVFGGFDAIGGLLGNTIGSTLAGVHQTQAPNILQRAVVTEVFTDLSLYTPEDFDLIRDNLTNPDFPGGGLATCPRNTILARVITAGQDKRSGKETLCYPFFPPYLCFPVKAGEQVWLITENPQTVGGPGYWMCRIPEPNYVDDLNYTHGDRKNVDTPIQTTSEKASSDPAEEAPNFINGAGDSDSFTLIQPLAYEDIVESSISYRDFTPEPVPRFTKRCPDLVLQGSNNTLISLGEDRGWSKSADAASAKNSNATKPAGETDKGQEGTIDIVAGRGRRMAGGNPADPVDGDPPNNTAPGIIRNTRGKLEVNKNPAVTVGGINANRLVDPTEGDPDFEGDASRVYVSMKTSGDDNFGLTYKNKDAEPGVADKPYVILKSDEIRIVSREGGSIRLVKEAENQCEVSMLSNGNLAIEASKIYLGEHPDGPEAEPVMMGAKLEAALHAYADGVSSTITGLLGNMGAPLIANAAISGPTAAFKAAVTEALSQTTFTK